MADVRPLRALHYDLDRVGGLDAVVAPPYDVVDAEERARLAARSPHNVVIVDLPEGDDPYAHASAELERWVRDGVVVRDEEPALWALTQAYTGPDGRPRERHGFLCRVRIEEYGAGRIRPHERTHPGPREDRLRLTRATRANLSPIFSLYTDPPGIAWGALAPATEGEPWGEATDADGTLNRIWRVGDTEAIDTVHQALADSELLIADGHHRYETARVYAEEVGGEGDHGYVLMCLVALEDPGLEVFPTHRLVRGLDSEMPETLATAIRRDFEIEAVTPERIVPAPGDNGFVRMGYMDSHLKRAFHLTLRDPQIAADALPDRSDAYRALDTAVLESLLLKGPLGLTDDDISHLRGLGYARDADEALALLEAATYDVGFFMAPTPVERIRAVAAAGESMPPKSTYFYPKVPTGLLFNPLDG